MSEHTADAWLWDLEPPSYARVSDCGRYRYTLGRRWDNGPVATFVMLNPSTADASQDDPTIRRCIGFAKALGCGGLHVVNLYAFRATKPADLWKAADPIGPENDETLRSAFLTAYGEGSPVIAAWGANAAPLRAEFVSVIARAAGVTLTALGVTKDGAPRHPLYLPSTSTPGPWRFPTPPRFDRGAVMTRDPDDFDEPTPPTPEDRTSTDERSAALAERARAEALYDARQMRYGENVPSAQELAGER